VAFSFLSLHPTLVAILGAFLHSLTLSLEVITGMNQTHAHKAHNNMTFLSQYVFIYLVG
jgi:hypothetical protein